MAVVADWVLNWQKIWQAQADAKYADDLKVYEQNRTDWVTHNIRQREQGLPITAAPTIPKYRTWKVAANGAQLESEDTQDPKISDPVLPPPPKPSTTPLVTGANAAQDAMMQMLAGCLQMLAEQRALIDALTKAVAEMKK